MTGLRRLARIARKELSEILRDRRTIVTLVAMPLLLYPLLSVAFLQFAWLGKADAERGPQTYTLGFADEAEARVLFRVLARGGHKDTPHLDVVTGSRESLAAELRGGSIDVVVSIPGAEKVVEGEAVRLHGRDWEFACELRYVAGAPGGQGVLAYLERRLAASDAANLARRLNLPGAGPHLVLLRAERAAVQIEEHNHLASLASLVPLILILMTVTGAVYPAIDLTAGERERGTLEILVAAPVPRFSLLAAKYVAVVAVAVLTALVNLVSMAVTLEVSGLGKQLFGSALSLLVLVEMLGLLLLFAAFFAALLLSLTSFARSFKEAQAYLIPLMLGAIGPGVLAMMPGLKLRSELAVLPLVNLVLLARDLFLGQADPVLALVVVVTTLLYALAALALAARVFGAESVLYSEQTAWSDLLRRPDEPQPAPSIPSALWCLALAVPLHFLVQGLMRPETSDVSQVGSRTVAIGLAIGALLSVVLFVGLPVGAAYLGWVRPRYAFGLCVPRPAAFVAGLVLGGSLWPLVLRFLEHSTSITAADTAIVGLLHSAAGPLLMATTIVAAVSEEIFFRGYLFAALRARSGAVVTVGVTALLFGVAHVFLGGALGLERLLPSTLLGIVLGVVCWVSGSVVPGTLLHVTHNAILVSLLLGGWSETGIPALWVALGAAGAVAGMGLLWIGRMRCGNAASG